MENTISFRHSLAILSGILFCFILFFWVFSAILLPFVAGMILAYCLDPLADKLERIGFSRFWATSSILLFSFSFLIVLLMVIIPILQVQFLHFMGNLPAYTAKLTTFINEVIPSWVQQKASSLAASKQLPPLGEFVTKGMGFSAAFLTSLWSGSLAFFNMISLIFITPVVAFYLLNDWDHMVKVVDACLPRRYAPICRTIACDIDQTLSGFIRGQSMVCLTLGLFYGIFLSIAGLNFGLLIGLVTGLLSFVPFVGALLGGVTAFGVALVQFWPDWFSFGVVVVIFILGQALEGHFLQPLLVGGKIGVHPVWLIFSLFAFGYLFGFFGLLLAVPMAGIVAVLVKTFMRFYFTTAFYLALPPQEGEKV